MDTKVYFEKWAEKLSVPVEDIQAEFDSIVNNDLKEFELSVEDKEKRALQMLVLHYKKQLRSPAIGFEGMIIGVGDLFDMSRKLRQTAMDAFRENPHDAIENGVTDADGNPLDNRAVFGSGKENRQFGKPLPEHNYIRNIVGVALRANVEEAPKVFTMSISGDKAENLVIPVFTPVKFRAINKSDDSDTQFTLNGSSVTEFVVSDKIQMPAPQIVLEKVCGHMMVPLNELDEYHKTAKDDFNRLSVTLADVSMIGENVTSVGNRMMVLEDMAASMDDLDAPGTTCWVPESIDLDFGEGSKVLVIGKTSQGKSRDDPNELGEVMINVMGVYALPEYKIELEPEEEEVEEPVVKEEPNETDAEATEKAIEEAVSPEPPTETKPEVQTDLSSGW